MGSNTQAISVQGVAELRDALSTLANDLGGSKANNALRAAGRAVAAEARKEARRRVPKRSRRLYKNIVVKRSKRLSSRFGETFVLSWATGKGKASHGHLVELGGPKNRPEHFLRDAADKVRPMAPEIYRKKLEAAIARAYAKAGVRR